MQLLDPMDVSDRPLLLNMQGNILKGHGRDHTTHIFFRFNEGHKDAAQKWLKEFAKAHVTCFDKQLKERELFNRNGTPGTLFASVFLSRAGYEYLGFADVQQKLTDAGFLLGMRGRADNNDESLNVNNDPPSKDWEEGFRGEIHAMILLADDDLRRMGETATELLKDNLEDISHICSIEYGHAIRNANRDGIEHFGYVDGVSQPLFLKDEVDAYMKFHNIKLDNKEELIGNELKFDPRADTKLVLIPDPFVPGNTPEGEDNTLEKERNTSYGSYFVFRKLEQDVRGFKGKEEEIGKVLFPDKPSASKQEKKAIEEKREIVGAYLVGRFEDGTPVVIDDTDGLIGSGNFNNFNYDYKETDPSGGRCPHFAHIRKTNPRRKNDDKKHIMARRGIPFGHRAIDTALGIDPSPYQMPENGVGLLFMSYQKSIKDQFEFIQQSWANSEDQPSGTLAGIDPIIGQSEGGVGRTYKFPKQYGNPSAGTVSNDFKQFVHMKGGEYFFAPSLSFLSNIDTILE